MKFYCSQVRNRNIGWVLWNNGITESWWMGAIEVT